MSMTFPSSPTVGQQYSVSGGPTYTWDGTVWKILTPGSQFSEQQFTATAGQTSFTVSGGYVIGAIDVFKNGVKLVNGQDYAATDLATVVLSAACSAGDTIEVVKAAQILYADALKATNNLSDVANAATARANLGAVSKAGDTLTGNLNISTGNTGGTVLNLTNSSTGGGSWNLFSTGSANGEGAGKLLLMKDGLGVAQQIDGSGRVTMPYQPSFRAGIGGPTTLVSGSLYPFNTAPFDNGGNFNTSTYRFTAAVSGKYFISAAAGYFIDGNNSVRYFNAAFRKNGVVQMATAVNTSSVSTSENDHGSSTVLGVLSLSAGDYVDVQCDFGGYTGTISSYQGCFSGFLLG